MQKNLCLSCAMDLVKRADIRSFGRPTHLGMCAACGDRMLVTAYDVPDIPVKAEKPEAKVMDAPAVPTVKAQENPKTEGQPLRQKITIEVDVRTVNKILFFSRLWGTEQGRVVDTLMTTFLRRGRELHGK